MTDLDLNLINQARQTLAGRIRQTPVEPSPLLSEILGVPTWLKLEFLQRTGSFKLRGAFFRLATLGETERRRGVATCSAGNHGLGVAYAGHQLGIPVTVYVPETVDEAKYRAMVALGATVIRAPFPGFDESQRWAIAAVAQKGGIFISAFDDYRIIAGQRRDIGGRSVGRGPGCPQFHPAGQRRRPVRRVCLLRQGQGPRGARSSAASIRDLPGSSSPCSAGQP